MSIKRILAFALAFAAPAAFAQAPFRNPAVQTDALSDYAGTGRPTVTYGVLSPEGDYTNSGYMFTESGNDTGITSPSDGLMVFYANAQVGMKVDPNGPSEIRGVAYIWPNAHGATGSVLTDTDGAGTLSWAAPTAGTAPLAISQLFDYNGVNNTQNSIYTQYMPTGPGNNQTMLQIASDVTADQAVDSITTLRLINNTQMSANVTNENTAINTTQAVGNNTNPTTVNITRGILATVNVGNQTTLASAEYINYGLNGPAGSGVGDTSFIRDSSQIDHLTQGYSGFELRPTMGTIENNWFGFNHNAHITHIKQGLFPFAVGNTWNVVDGNANDIDLGQHIDTANSSLTLLSTHTSVDDMPGLNSGWSMINAGDDVTNSGGSVGGLTLLSTHLNVAGQVRDDVDGWEEGGSYADIERNFNFYNIHPNVTALRSNFSNFNSSPHIVELNGSYTEFMSNPQVDALAFNYQGVNINPRLTAATPAAFDFTIIPVADVAGSLAGKNFVIPIPYTAGGNNVSPWFKVSGVGTDPGCCGNSIEVDIATGDSAATIATAIATTLSGFSPASSNYTITDLTGSVQFVANVAGAGNSIALQESGFSKTVATYGAGSGSAEGIVVNMSQVSGYPLGQVHGIDVQNGDLHVQAHMPIATESNPSGVNSVNTEFSAPASTTTASADQAGFSSSLSLQLAHDSHTTSGAFGFGTQASAMFNIVQMDDASTIQDLGGIFVVNVPIGGTGAGGVIGMQHGFQFVGLPGSATGSPTLTTSAKAFEARAPAGAFTTSNAWGLYADSNFDQNYMAGHLKVGSGTDTTTNVLQVEGTGAATMARVHNGTNSAGANGLEVEGNRVGNDAFIQRWMVSGFELGRITSTGFGIGTNNPASALDVHAGLNGQPIARVINTTNAASTDGLWVETRRAASDANVQKWSANGVELGRFTSDGKLGIGDTAPGSSMETIKGANSSPLLTLKSSTSNTTLLDFSYDGVSNLISTHGDNLRVTGGGFMMVDDALATNTGMSITPTKYATAGVPLTASLLNFHSYAWNGSNGSSIGSTANVELTQLSTTSDDAQLDLGPQIHTTVLNGNTGIGLVAPTARLHVSGATTDNTTNALDVADSATTSLFKVRDDGTIAISGSVGIGFASPPPDPLDVVSNVSAGPLQGWANLADGTSALLKSNGGGMSLSLVGSTSDINIGNGGTSELKINNQVAMQDENGTGTSGQLGIGGQFGSIGIYRNANVFTAIFDATGNFGVGTAGGANARAEIEGSTADNTANALNVEDSSAVSLLKVVNDGSVIISDAGGHTGNVPHACHVVHPAAGTSTASCPANEIATGGGVDCGSTALFTSFSKGTPTNGPWTGWTGSCTSLLNVVTNTTILVEANCCAY